MGLNSNSAKKLNSNFSSYLNLKDLIVDIFKVNRINKRKILYVTSTILILTICSFALTHNFSFNIIFEKLSDISITLSIGLFGTLIASFSIAISGLNRNSLYCLILNIDEKRNRNSYFKNSILICFEPLIWFLVLLFITLIFELSYFLYKPEFFSTDINYLIKAIVISIMLNLLTFSLISMKTFLLNFCNLLFMCAKFEITFRRAGTDENIDTLISELEKDFESKMK